MTADPTRSTLHIQTAEPAPSELVHNLVIATENLLEHLASVRRAPDDMPEVIGVTVVGGYVITIDRRPDDQSRIIGLRHVHADRPES